MDNKKLRGRLVSKRKGNNGGCYADVRLETGMCDRNRDSIHTFWFTEGRHYFNRARLPHINRFLHFAPTHTSR
jgi:hypothetical protein